MKNTGLCSYKTHCAAKVDIGQKRPSNEDAVICCPDYGFFAVTDGMGGLYGGGETAEIIALVLPGLPKHPIKCLCMIRGRSGRPSS